MRLSTFLSTASIIPALVAGSSFIDVSNDHVARQLQQRQQHFPIANSRLERVVVTATRSSSSATRGGGEARAGGTKTNESVVVHLVDPASPTTSTLVTPSSIARQALDYSPEDDNEDDDENDDAPNFGAQCRYEEGNPFSVCGDFYDAETETDHGLFCSPRGICAGKGAVCGSNAACSQGLVCNLSSHRCELSTALSRTISESRKHARQRTAISMCPEQARACTSQFGGFECVFTDSEVTQCGGCLELGGTDCSSIPNSLATSCRQGTCKIHACVAGYLPSEDGTECIDEFLL